MFFLIIHKDTTKKRDEQQKRGIFFKKFQHRAILQNPTLPLPINF